jgi:hypothetical protein
MADKEIKLNYTPTGNPAPNDMDFRPDVNPIHVRPGQTISFKLGNGPANGKIRLTFVAPHFFRTGDPNFHQTGKFHDGDGDVHVTAAIPNGTKTTYHCELLVDGVPLAQSHESPGGEIVPDTGG